jgi:3-hydroxybutyryl-CoA dehydrogenase
MNGWTGFLSKPIKEIALTSYFGEQQLKDVMDALQWQYIVAPDVPGFASCRTIAMIINEAYFALGENVSSREDIDIAMKLGTNYPYGPFEWSAKIGLQNIYALLDTLSKTDNRYTIAPLLTDEVQLLHN